MQLDFRVFRRMNSFVVIVDGDRQRSFRSLLPDDILAENAVYLFRLRRRALPEGGNLDGFLLFAPNQIVAKIDAIHADAPMNAENQLLDLIPRFAAEDAAAIDSVETP